MAEALAAKAGIFVASEAAKALIDLVKGRGAEEVSLFVWGSKNQRETLTRKLARVQAFLEDLGTQSSEEETKVVGDWLNAVKSVAYTADNLMDDYAYETLRTKLESNNNNCCFPGIRMLSSYNIRFRFRMHCKVREILGEFDKIDRDAQAIGLRQVEIAVNARSAVHHNRNNNKPRSGGPAAAWNQAREHASHTAGFIGREKDVNVLLDMMCHPPANELSTFAIVGMGGLGKTTFARRLYDHERTDAHFGKDNKHWMSATDFNITRILNEIAESVPSNRTLSNTDVIIRNLKDKMKGIKSLVVLDDVWEDNGELWDSFKGRLRETGALPGSVLLITTRKQSVAAKAGVVSPHLLQPLSSHESWAILEKSLIIGSNVSHMEEVERRIIEKCKGVPLAIKVMAGLLKSKQRPSDWEKIEDSEVWDLPQGQTEILPSLMLSFNHLPSPCLKQCFAYCAVIPKGSFMYKNELIGLWLSQGYLRDDKRTTMEDIGEEYLQILVSHSLLEERIAQSARSREVVFYSMHDLVYDLAVYVSGNDLLEEANYLRDKGGFLHLVFYAGQGMSSTSGLSADKNALTMLRTVRFVGTLGSVPWDLLIHARYLRTLFLVQTGITEVPSAIESLKHLRYFDVSDNPISTLPDSIAKLYQLETLVLQECCQMRKLPKALNTLVSLRHIFATSPMYAWKGLRQLSHLETLPCLHLDDDGEGWSIDELGELDGLRDDIEIKGLECVKDKEQARKAGLAGKAKVTKISLSWDRGRRATNGAVSNDEEVLDGLEPHPNITSLEVENFNGDQFPTWITRMGVLTAGGRRGCRTLLSNLTEVNLVKCRCRIIPTLGQLPLLKSLVLDGLDVECIGNEFYGSDLAATMVSFQALRELMVSRLGRLTTWMAPPQEAFPRLEVLQVTDCCLLESLPVALGSKSLRNLILLNLESMQSLDIIRDCTGLKYVYMDSIPEIRCIPEELGNCSKLQELLIVGFEKLVCLPSGSTSLISLQGLVLCNCASLRKIPASLLEGSTSLETLTLSNCPMMEAPLGDISTMVSVSHLSISCHTVEHLRSLLGALQHLPRLRSLSIKLRVNEEEMRESFSDVTPFNHHPSLDHLTLDGSPKIRTLPRQLGLLTRITQLTISQFEDLEEIPDWVCDLSSLVELELAYCANLKRLPPKQALQRLLRLKTLRFRGSPLLEGRYAKENGPEWNAISHLTFIKIDGEVIQDLTCMT